MATPIRRRKGEGKRVVKSGEYEKYMRLALDLAAEAGRAGEIPVGCVIVDGTGAVLGRGRNRREETRSVTGHAELEALEAACRARGDWRLDDCAAFVSLEPCPMCAGALLNARIGALIYAAREPVTGSAGSVLNLFAEGYPGKTAVTGGVLREESERLLRAFFAQRR
ncbi:MAG: nucleoside deaminase [Oscillospiraceae bacterium]|nr:nucleoside deaminase [Oscillospiraceae bacterium]